MRGAIVVLTGATGFVGARLLRALLERGAEVRVLVRDPGRFPPIDERVTVHACDLESASMDARAFTGASHVLHLAAHIPKDMRSPSEAERCLRVNGLGTLALAQAAINANVKHFVSFSSANAYAWQPRPVREDDPVYPAERATYYLASKTCGELYVEHARRAQGLSSCILRVSAVYGPGMPFASSVMTFASRLRAREAITVHEGGRFSSDLVHVDDVVSAALTATERRAQGVLNVGSGIGTSTLTLAEMLADLVGAPRELIEVVAPTSEGPLGFSALDLSRARELLDYAPRALRDGLASLLSEERSA